MALVLPTVAAAQVGVAPSFAVTETYDGNLYVTASNPQSTLVHRLGPRIAVDHRSATSSLVGRYELDAEYLQEVPAEGIFIARQLGALDLSSELTPRIVIEGGASYVDTRSALQLSPLTALDQGRIRARRFSVGASGTYAFTSRASGELGYRFTLDDTPGLTAHAHVANAGIEHRFTRRDTGEVLMIVRGFTFDGAAVVPAEVVLLGWTRWLARRTSATLHAGPRFRGADADGVEADAVLRHAIDHTDLEASYSRTQTMAFGTPGTLETDAAALAATLTLEPSALHGRVGVARTHGAALEADVLHAHVAATTQLHPWLEAELSVTLTWQRLGATTAAGPATGGDGLSFHDVVALTLVVAPPEPLQLR